MSTHGGRGEVGLALAALRMLRGWERADLVRALGVSRSWISEIETGKKEPSVRTVQRITGALGLPMSAVEEALALVRSVRGMVAAGAGGGMGGGRGGRQVGRNQRGGDALAQADAGLAWDGTGLSGVLFELIEEGMRAGRGDHGNGDAGEGFGAEGGGAEDGAGKGAGNGGPGDPEGARRRATELWARLRPYSREVRRVLVREVTEFQSWALCERLCGESARVGAENPAVALELAELAVEVASVVPVDRAWAAVPAGLAGVGSPGELPVPPVAATLCPAIGPTDAKRCRDWLSGYAWAFVGEAQRLGGDPVAGEGAFARSRELWPAGVPGETSELDGLDLVELAASLRRGRGWGE